MVYTIKDFGGKMLDLKVKETDTELRSDWLPMCLFDFDQGGHPAESKTVLGPGCRSASPEGQGDGAN